MSRHAEAHGFADKRLRLKHVERVLVMPQDGIGAVVALIGSARRSLMVKMFTFDSPTLLEAVVAAKARGVSVRVMLNPRRSSGSRANDATMGALRAAGVDARWTSEHFAVTHEKSMVVDGRLALIATFNFMDKYFTATRDYGVLVSQPETVRHIIDCFEADWAEQAYELPPNTPLLLSNGNARQAMAEFIDGADHRLLVQHPKYADLAIVDRLLAAKARGVKVHVLCGGRHGISPSDAMDTFSALRMFQRAGIHLREQHGLRLHAKLLLADDGHALIGSMNIDRSAFDLRRELGVAFDDRHAIRALHHRFERDWDEAHPYQPPDPIFLDLITAVDQLPDSIDQDLVHE